MACLIELYIEQQGHIIKSYTHELCKHLKEPSPYEYEFEIKNRIEYNPNRKDRKDWVGNFKW